MLFTLQVALLVLMALVANKNVTASGPICAIDLLDHVLWVVRLGGEVRPAKKVINT